MYYFYRVVFDLWLVFPQDFLFSRLSFLKYFHYCFILARQKLARIWIRVDDDDEDSTIPGIGSGSIARACLLELLTEVDGPGLWPIRVGLA